MSVAPIDLHAPQPVSYWSKAILAAAVLLVVAGLFTTLLVVAAQ